MGELINIDKESLSSDRMRQSVFQSKELNESIRMVQEEKPFILDVNENELHKGSKQTITFVTKIEIEENPFTYNCHACYEGFQKESEMNTHSCPLTPKEKHPFTNSRDVFVRRFSGEFEKEIPLKVKEEEDSVLHNMWEKNSDESESRILPERSPLACVCGICEKEFRKQSEMNAHLHTHKKGRRFCCDKKISSDTDLKCHLRSHAERKYVCQVCSKDYSRRFLFHRHVRRHAKDEMKPFVCTVCGSRFSDEFKMKMHHIGHTVEPPFVCDVCKKEFSKKQHFVRHIYLHTGERPFVCEVCNKGFYRQSELKIHSFIHDQEKQIRCKFCKKSFLRKNALKIHLRNHTGDKPFVCSVCTKGFSQACDLRIHSYVHTKERPFACDVCNKGFYKKSFLVRHRRTHEKAKHSAPNVISKKKPFACDICDERFSRKCEVMSHRRIHETANHFVQETFDDQEVEVTVANKTDYSASNEASHEAKAEISSKEKASYRFVLSEKSGDSGAKVSFVKKWVSSTEKNSHTRSVDNRRCNSEKLSVGDTRRREIYPKRKKVTRQRKEKVIVPGSFACKECDKVYSQPNSLKKHVQAHKLEATGVNRHILAQRVTETKSLEEKIHLFAPFKNFV